MQFRLSILLALLAGFVIVPSAAADPPKELKEKTAESKVASKSEPLSREEQKKKDQEEKARLEALRLKVVSNVSPLIEQLNLSRSQKVRVNALLEEDQWETAVETFKSTRQTEIHDHAHNVAKTTIPGIMRKFMPAYMQKKIQAQRRKEKRRGPPSRNEIAKIQSRCIFHAGVVQLVHFLYLLPVEITRGVLARRHELAFGLVYFTLDHFWRESLIVYL